MQDYSNVLSHKAQFENGGDEGSQDTAATAYPKIPPVQVENIPELLKGVKQWIVWRAGPFKPNGKFDKIPTCPRTGRNINHLDESNWFTFNEAVAACERGIGDGVGFVLSAKHKVTIDATDYHIVAVDLDGVIGRKALVQEVRLKLGRPYIEASPSRKGLRLFALSTEPIRGGNAGDGRELYYDKRFVTVTGWLAKGKVKDATAGLTALSEEWFGGKGTPTAKVSVDDFGLGYNLGSAPPPETEDEIARVKDALSYVSPDVHYELWRNIVWAILSTGWKCAEQLAREWSLGVSSIEGAKHVYEESAFYALVRDFDPTRGMGIGTLFQEAKDTGWDSSRARWQDPVIRVAPPAAPLSFKLLTAAEVMARPNTPYRVRGLLPAQGVAAIYGQPGTGKSFLAMDMCFAVAAGHAEWFGMKLKQVPVVWVALEGRGGVSKRIKAWVAEQGTAVPAGAWFVLDDLVMSNAQSVDAFASALGDRARGAIIVIDTLNQSAPGMDENASTDVGAVLANAKKLAERVNGLVLLIHHAGKDATKGMRGHSSLNAAMDATILVAKDKGHRYFTVTKAKDDEEGGTLDFELTSHVVGQDEDGFEITSCGVRPTIHTPAAATTKKPPTGKHQIAALTKVRELLAGASDGLSYAEAVEGVAAVLDCEGRRRKSITKGTVNSLIESGHLQLDEGVITLP